MPTYQYACTECGERLEVVQKFTDDPLTVCPACEGRLRKLFSPVGVVFKGSGFYKTDSRSKPSDGSGSSAKPATADKTSGADKGSGSDQPASSAKSASPAPSESASSPAPAAPAKSGDGSKVA